MKATLTAIGLALALVFALAVGIGRTWADDAENPTSPDLLKVLAQAGEPGPGHARLQRLAGRWTYTCKFWMDPSQPPLESEGTIERKWILGGRFLEERMEGTRFDGQPGFESFGLIGYDNTQKKYTSTWACSMCTSTCSGLGLWKSSDAITFQTEAFCPMLKRVVQGREELRFESDDKTVAESYKVEDGQETKVMQIVATRKE